MRACQPKRWWCCGNVRDVLMCTRAAFRGSERRRSQASSIPFHSSQAEPNQVNSQATLSHVKSSHVKSSHVASNRVKSRRATPRHATPRHATPRHVTSRHHATSSQRALGPEVVALRGGAVGLIDGEAEQTTGQVGCRHARLDPRARLKRAAMYLLTWWVHRQASIKSEPSLRREESLLLPFLLLRSPSTGFVVGIRVRVRREEVRGRGRASHPFAAWRAKAWTWQCVPV